MTFIRKMTVLAAVLTILISGTVSGGFLSQEVYAKDDQTVQAQSSFEYKIYPEHFEYRIALKGKMKSVYDVISGSMNDSRTFPIPGLVSTNTLQDNTVRTSRQFVPQGLCSAGDYMLITAYDVRKKQNSVIYAVDMRSNELVSTLTLPNKYHAGGIAFDGENIWMTGDTSDKYKGEPFVQYMTYDTFLRLIENPLSEVTKRDLSDFIYIKNKPSFLECDNGILWVGTYIGRKDTAESYMNGYKIVGEPGDRKLNTILYSMITGLDSSAQGADIAGNYLYASSSYKGTARGVKTSFVTKYYLGAAARQGLDVNVRNREVCRIEVPKMNEEIIVRDSTVYINFESGAAYWWRAVINTDRVLAVKETLWRNAHEE